MNFDELRREAEEIKERLKRDVLELRAILTRVADELGTNSPGEEETEETVRKEERHIGETVSNLEKRFEKAIGLVARHQSPANNPVTREYDFTGFSNIEVDCAFRVEILRADKHHVSICANDVLIDSVNVNKSGNTLKLSLKPHPYQTRPVAEAIISMPRLSKIRLSAATKGVCKGFSSSENLDVNLSGNSTLQADLTTGNLKCEISGASCITGKMSAADVEFVLSGASRCELTGAAQNAVLNAWGASKLAMPDFQMVDAGIHLQGASEASVNTSGNMVIDLGSGSHLTYAGNPTIQSISVTGASSLNRR